MLMLTVYYKKLPITMSNVIYRLSAGKRVTSMRMSADAYTVRLALIYFSFSLLLDISRKEIRVL